jgi:PadR family transcriptional regulator, regulatory protein PadR
MEMPLTARTALLQTLVRGAGYGLELIERVRNASGGQIVLNQGSAYPALRSLERAGLVRSWESEPLPERGGRPRRYYELTAEGVRAAREQHSTVTQFFLSSAPA